MIRWRMVASWRGGMSAGLVRRCRLRRAASLTAAAWDQVGVVMVVLLVLVYISLIVIISSVE